MAISRRYNVIAKKIYARKHDRAQTKMPYADWRVVHLYWHASLQKSHAGRSRELIAGFLTRNELVDS